MTLLKVSLRQVQIVCRIILLKAQFLDPGPTELARECTGERATIMSLVTYTCTCSSGDQLEGSGLV